jgi:hypothetical protein
MIIYILFGMELIIGKPRIRPHHSNTRKIIHALPTYDGLLSKDSKNSSRDNDAS